jgi:hypothetical protein
LPTAEVDDHADGNCVVVSCLSTDLRGSSFGNPGDDTLSQIDSCLSSAQNIQVLDSSKQGTHRMFYWC